jgi:hypothetical protein
LPQEWRHDFDWDDPLATTDAIASVGDTLVSLLGKGLSVLGVAPLDVILATPDDFKQFTPIRPSVTVFLYHVAINGERRNSSRRSTGTGASQPPQLPLDLRFLITPWTQTPRAAYRIVGAIALLFYEHAILRFGELVDPSNDIWQSDDTVEVMMESLPVEEQYDIWEPTEVPYRLSLAYLARVVGIDSAVSEDAPFVTSLTLSKGTP